MASSIERLFEPIVPLGAALRGGSIGSKEIGLFGPERVAVASAISARRREFAAGRRFARRALRALGGPRTALPPDPDRAPVWPEGFVGSITHSEGDAAAIAAPRSRFMSLGLDLEVIARVSHSLIGWIATPQERSWIGADDDAGLRLALVFSAKESWHKCQFPLTRQVYDLPEVSVRFDLQQGRFEIGLSADQAEGCAPARGHFAFDERRVATIVARSV